MPSQGSLTQLQRRQQLAWRRPPSRFPLCPALPRRGVIGCGPLGRCRPGVHPRARLPFGAARQVRLRRSCLPHASRRAAPRLAARRQTISRSHHVGQLHRLRCALHQLARRPGALPLLLRLLCRADLRATASRRALDVVGLARARHIRSARRERGPRRRPHLPLQLQQPPSGRYLQ